MLKVEKLKDATLEVKRLYISSVLDIKAKCPYCGEMVGFDNHGYMSYPNVGSKVELYFCHDCKGCEANDGWYEDVVLEINLRQATEEDEEEL